MEKCNAGERSIGVDFHKQTTVVTRLRPDGSRIGRAERIQTNLKNRVRRLLAKAGERVEAKDLFSRKGLWELQALSLGATREFIVENVARLAGPLEEQIKATEEEIERRVEMSAEARLVLCQH